MANTYEPGAKSSTRNKKRGINKNIIMVALSLMLGGGGVFLSKQFLDEKIAFYKNEFSKEREDMTEVVVVNRNMQNGQVINFEDMVLRKIPAAFAHDGAIRQASHEGAVGQRLTTNITEGKPLLWAHLDGSGNATFSDKVKEGHRALTFPVDEVNSFSGFLQPTDKIDLFLTRVLGKENTTMPLMQNLNVMATGIKTVVDNTNDGGVSTYRTITVQVSPADAKRIILARDAGKITAALRHPEDNKLMSNKKLTVSQLLGIKPKPRKKRIIRTGIEFIVGGV